MPMSLQQVSVVSTDDGRILLQELQLTLQDGALTLLIGRTGSGKSTLLQVLAGIREPSSGTIRLDGRPLWERGRVDKSQLLRLGLVFQFPEQQLFARSISREFAYSLHPYRLEAEERERRIQAACREFDPEGAFTMDRSPFSLSGGQQRRLALATTFASAPDWLLMDEPTAGLEAAAVRELLQLIRGRSRERGGMVIATHDLDTFLPLADRVVVLAGGAVAFDGTPAELCSRPELMLQAGVGLPGCAELAGALHRQGVAIPSDRLTPELAAAAIAEVLAAAEAPARERELHAQEASPHWQEPAARDRLSPPAEGETEVPAYERELHAQEVPPQRQEPVAHEQAESVWHRTDPRAKWLLYMLLVTGTMLQSRWLGLAASAVPVAVCLIGMPPAAVRSGIRFIKPFMLFMIISVALAGIEINADSGRVAIHFAADRASVTAFYVARLFVVTLASYWLSAVTTYGRMVDGLNWALKRFKKLGLPVESFSLAVSLMFRFIPLILREWQRFSAIVRARGKAALRPGMIRIRDIPAMVVPLLLSLFHRAEAMTMAMELKKVGQQPFTAKRSSLQWKQTDTLTAAAAVVCFAVLILVSVKL